MLSDREIYAAWDRLESALVHALRRETRIVQRWFAQNSKAADFVRECARKALVRRPSKPGIKAAGRSAGEGR
jgi:hypothetical protein